jgi:hypothetical protein
MKKSVIPTFTGFASKMKRAASAATMLGLSTFGALAQENPLVGTWQSQVGQLTFAVDGHAWGHQRSGGVVYTSFGSYSAQGDWLSVHFDSVRPAYQCSNLGCLPAMPMGSASFRVRFQGPNAFIWGFDTSAPTYFQRVEK